VPEVAPRTREQGASKVRHYCTYFDSNYLPKGLALYQSLVAQAEPFWLWVLCFDETTHAVLTKLALPEVRSISLDEFESADPALLEAKANRSRFEYYFTCTPSLPLYVFAQNPVIDTVSYVDADLYFFEHPDPIHSALDNGSILIIDHRFPPHLAHLTKYGRFNVGYLAFRRSPDGLACLQSWRIQCIEWCYDRLEADRFADQKYLDAWPERFSGVVELAHKGAGLAPWNLSTFPLDRVRGRVYVGGEPLIFYHFHGLSSLNRWLHVASLKEYGHRLSPLLKHHVYAPYVRELNRAAQLAQTVAPHLGVKGNPRRGPSTLRTAITHLLNRDMLLVRGRLAL
jgi:hypothetical protein